MPFSTELMLSRFIPEFDSFEVFVSFYLLLADTKFTPINTLLNTSIELIILLNFMTFLLIFILMKKHL